MRAAGSVVREFAPIDQSSVPEIGVLFVDRHQLPCEINPRRSASQGETNQGGEAADLGLIGRLARTSRWAMVDDGTANAAPM